MGTLAVHNANVHQALAMNPHGIVLECPTGCHGDRHAGIYSSLSLASCPISCCPVWGGGGQSRPLWSAFWVYFPLIAAVYVVNLIWGFMEIDQAGGVRVCWALYKAHLGRSAAQ